MECEDINKPPVECNDNIENKTECFIQSKNEKRPKAKEKKKIRNHHIDSEQKSSSQRSTTEKRPANAIRYDQLAHLPEIDEKQNGTRCKNDNCQQKTHILCSKCQVHLCLVQSRNCFKDFHLLKISGENE